jgi:hypothetical protein
MTSSDASQSLILQLQLLAPYWPDANVFLEYAEAGLLTDIQEQELLRHIAVADQWEIQKESQTLQENTRSILTALRERERVERLQEEPILQFWF